MDSRICEPFVDSFERRGNIRKPLAQLANISNAVGETMQEAGKVQRAKASAFRKEAVTHHCENSVIWGFSLRGHLLLTQTKWLSLLPT